MIRFGDRSRFAIEIARDPDEPSGRLRVVDIYAANRWLTCDDNVAFVPQFNISVHREMSRLLSPDADERYRRPFPELSPVETLRRIDSTEEDTNHYSRHRVLSWGPTTDNVLAFLFVDENTAWLTFSFWRAEHHNPSEMGQVFVAELPWRELVLVMHQALWELRK